MVSNRAIFITIILICIILLIEVFYFTDPLSDKYVLVTDILGTSSIALILISGLVYRKMVKEKENKLAIGMFLGKLILDVVVMIAIVGINPSKMWYYSVINLIASIFVLIGVADNITHSEKKETDFRIMIHDSKSMIPAKAVPFMYIIIFVAYTSMIWLLGNTLIAYPFSATGNIENALANSLPVGDAENLCFIVMFYALTSYFMRYIGIRKGTYNRWAVFIVSLLVSISSFELYHTFVYGQNYIALISVAVFGFMGITLYEVTKSLLCSLSPLHDSNNFGGSILKRVVFGQSVVGDTLGSVIGIIVPIAIFVLALFIAWRFTRRRR